MKPNREDWELYEKAVSDLDETLSHIAISVLRNSADVFGGVYRLRQCEEKLKEVLLETFVHAKAMNTALRKTIEGFEDQTEEEDELPPQQASEENIQTGFIT